MRVLLHGSLLLFVVLLRAAGAELTDAADTGFTTVHEASIEASRDVVWKAAIEDVGTWWNPDHTVSGNAERLSIEAVTQGCFCEDFGAGAGVVHLSVTMVNPEVIIRFTGGLGPLGLMGVSGNMTWEFEDSTNGTDVRFTYAVGGYHADGLGAIAARVDLVIGEALARLTSYLEDGEAINVDAG